MDNEVTYTEPVEFTLAGTEADGPITIKWSPESGISAGPGFKDGLAVTALDRFIQTYDLEYEGSYNVTPEGPTLKTNPTDIYMVSWAIHQLFEGGVVSAVGNYPTLRDMGLDEGSNYDDNGQQLIR